MENFADVFMMFAAETEGDIPTRRGKIQRAIKLLAETGNLCNDAEVQLNIFDTVGLGMDSLSDDEAQYIQEEVPKRKV